MSDGFWPEIRSQLNGSQYRPCGGVFAVEGTSYPGAPAPPTYILDDGTGYWCGFASGTIGGLINVSDGLWYSQCIGYPAATVPMWPSAQIGQHNLGVAIDSFAKSYKAQWGVYPPICVVSWSQGAIATDLWWTVDVLPENGSMHYIKDFVYRIYNYGDPLRSAGLSRGNDAAKLPPPGTLDGVTTGGVGGPQDLTADQTNVIAPDGQYVVLSFNNPGDLYGAAPVGDNPQKSLPAPGRVEYDFFRIVMQPTFLDVIEVGELIIHPIGDIEGGYNAAKFFSEGQNAPHFQYTAAMDWVIGDLVALGNSLPHSL